MKNVFFKNPIPNIDLARGENERIQQLREYYETAKTTYPILEKEAEENRNPIEYIPDGVINRDELLDNVRKLYESIDSIKKLHDSYIRHLKVSLIYLTKEERCKSIISEDGLNYWKDDFFELMLDIKCHHKNMSSLNIEKETLTQTSDAILSASATPTGSDNTLKELCKKICGIS